MIEGKIKFDSQPIVDRCSEDFREKLGNIWEKRTGIPRFFETVRSNGIFPARKYENYQHVHTAALLVLEQLFRAGSIPSGDLFNRKGKVKQEVAKEKWDAIFQEEDNKGILASLSIGVIGGPEGEIFAAMGATATSIDPFLGVLPPHNRSNLTELPEMLTPELAKSLSEQFNLTFSRYLFDKGSGVAAWYHDNEEQYVSTFADVIETTKVGGLSIHNGNMIETILKLLPEPKVTIVGAFAPHYGGRYEDDTTLFVVQRNI